MCSYLCQSATRVEEPWYGMATLTSVKAFWPWFNLHYFLLFALALLVEALRQKPEGGGLDSACTMAPGAIHPVK